MKLRIVLGALAVSLAGCPAPVVGEDAGEPDSGTVIPSDAGVDAGSNDAGGPDAGSADAGEDAGQTEDAGADAGREEDAGIDAGPPVVLVGLSVAPTTVALLADTRLAPATQAFTATGHYDGGPDQDLSASANWSIDRPVLGSIDAGLFTTAQAAGLGIVTAGFGGFSATATVEVSLNATVVASGTPSNAETILPPNSNAETILPPNGASTFTGGISPTLIYPSGGEQPPGVLDDGCAT